MADHTGWIRLSKTGASARRLNPLLEQFGSPEALFENSPERLSREGGFPLQVAERILDPVHAASTEELELIKRLQVQLVTRADRAYPPLLQQIYDPPPVLYVRGTLAPQDEIAVAVVGSRNSSAYGVGMAQQLARDLAAAGVTVVSGFARGIDAQAHRGALSAGGRTLAILGCGVDVSYPWSHRKLGEQVQGHGALISEYPMGAAPDAWHFPSRNRIVSGLCLGVVIVEAPRGSGALITAECATEQNREVFAVPGRIDDPRSYGPHGLIRDGARLVQSVDDILTELKLAPAAAQAELPLPEPDLTDEERRLWSRLTAEPKHIDDLILEADVPAGQVSATLMMLEIKGAARRTPGNCYARTR